MLKLRDLKPIFCAAVIVSALGYFVDIYDLLLFGIVRIQSLKDLGLTDEQVSSVGASILNWQMSGLLLGGIFWGVLGDKRGRISVLFGSILTYSLANLACGFLPNITWMNPVDAYQVLRFIAGVGLAGELGAGITLVSEVLPKHLRALGTSFVAGFGILGAVAANLTVAFTGKWTMAYTVGGVMGLLLLLLRVSALESGMYKQIESQAHIAKGNFFAFFTNKKRLLTYLRCIGIGVPIWFVIGILATFANEFSKDLKPGLAIMWCYVGLSAGDFLSGILSYKLESRKKTMIALEIFSFLGVLCFLLAQLESTFAFYTLYVWMGLGIGYWAMFVTVGAEQFGTNLRATAATTIPNMVRGTVVPVVLTFKYFKPSMGVIPVALLLAFVTFGLSLYCTSTIEETHHRDLNFME